MAIEIICCCGTLLNRLKLKMLWSRDNNDRVLVVVCRRQEESIEQVIKPVRVLSYSHWLDTRLLNVRRKTSELPIR